MTLAKRSELPPFSKIAFGNLGNEKMLVEKLNRELDTWVKSKQGVDDLIGRIQKVTNMSYNRAATIARTERTRVQGEARWEAIKELNRQRKGKKRYRKQWVARHDSKTRDTHSAMSGDTVRASEYFHSPSGATLMYPGDPTAPAAEIINCRCYMRKVAP